MENFMLVSSRKLATAVGVVAVLAFSSPGYAAPFTVGSFAMVAFTSTTTDVDTTSVFTLTSPVMAGSGVGNFAADPPPVVLMSPALLNFVTPAGFDWADVFSGSFVASDVAV